MKHTKNYFKIILILFMCMCRNIFGKIIFFALHVFLCAHVLRPVRARAHVHSLEGTLLTTVLHHGSGKRPVRDDCRQRGETQEVNEWRLPW